MLGYPNFGHFSEKTPLPWLCDKTSAALRTRRCQRTWPSAGNAWSFGLANVFCRDSMLPLEGWRGDISWLRLNITNLQKEQEKQGISQDL